MLHMVTSTCPAAGGGQRQTEQWHYIFHKLLHSIPGLLNCGHNFRPDIASHRPMDLQTTSYLSSADRFKCRLTPKTGLTGFCHTALWRCYACRQWCLGRDPNTTIREQRVQQNRLIPGKGPSMSAEGLKGFSNMPDVFVEHCGGCS